MDHSEPELLPPNFRVRTRIHPNSRPEEIESAVKLHPKVKAYLEQRSDVLRFEIYDSAFESFSGYGMKDIFARKLYYVPYSLADHLPILTGSGTVMIFDQLTGDLLYHGTDGGE